jgi:hypothetical protein
MILALGAAPAQANQAVLSVTSSDNGCYDLLAGQSIEAGDVCFAVDGSSLTVTYNTEGGWQLTEAHLWVAYDQDGYPQAKNGNPKIGNFPYNSGDITGATSHSFSVPLGSATIYAMAHAALRKVDGGGNVVQTETGWSDGEGAVQKGSWATRSAITLSVTCYEPPKPPTIGQETAIMFGNIVLNNDSDGICDGEIAANRWGWQAGPLSANGGDLNDGTYQFDIWAAAGNNVLENGTLVGYVDIEVMSGSVSVTPVL